MSCRDSPWFSPAFSSSLCFPLLSLPLYLSISKKPHLSSSRYLIIRPACLFLILPYCLTALALLLLLLLLPLLSMTLIIDLSLPARFTGGGSLRIPPLLACVFPVFSFPCLLLRLEHHRDLIGVSRGSQGGLKDLAARYRARRRARASPAIYAFSERLGVCRDGVRRMFHALRNRRNGLPGFRPRVQAGLLFITNISYSSHT